MDYLLISIRAGTVSLMFLLRTSQRLLIVTAMLALLICHVTRAQQPTPADEKTAETKTGAITGTVVNDSGQPLANAVVFVRAFGSSGQSRSTTTDSDGNFQLRGLDPLAYMVSASLPAYTLAPRDADSPQTPYFRVGDSVRLELIKGAVITGTVTSSSGEPLVGVRVRVFMIRAGNGQAARYEMPSRERTTDDRGVYRIYGLPAGTYVVSAGGGGGFSGSMRSPYDADVPTYAPASPRDTATEISLRPGEEATNVDIRYRGEPGHIISGSASGGAGPSGFNIRLTAIVNGAPQTSITSYQPPGSPGFVFNGVADGEYDLTAETYSPTGDVSVSELLRIKVSGSDKSGIELTTRPLGSIAGRIVLENSTASECKGKRRLLFAETLVTPWHNEKNVPKDRPQFMWGMGGPTLPDKLGEFTLRNLAAGQYRFNTRSLAKYWYLQSITFQASVAPAAKAAAANRPIDAARNWTTLKSGDRISALVITFAEGAASLRGQIKLAEGEKQPPKLFAYLVPAEKERSEEILRFFVSQVAADGTFALNNLPPGRYWALSRPAAENESNILSKLRLPDEGVVRAKLRGEAQAVKVEIELKPCQNITDYQLPSKPQ